MTNQPPNQPTTPTNRPPVDGRTVNRLGAVFYTVVAVVALIGQAGAAVGWLHWPLAVAVLAVGALELGGIVLSAMADHRRRLGERALGARLLSAAVALFAVVINWVGHPDRLAGGFFAGMSALGYLVWLLQSGNRRRDQLRADGMLPPVPPAYPVGLWLRHPWVTNRARALALADTNLGLYTSLDLARNLIRAEKQQGAIASVLRKALAKNSDRLTAEIAVTTYNLDEVAVRLRDQADYDGLTALVARRLNPARLIDQESAVEPTGKGSTNQRAALPAGPTGRVGQPALTGRRGNQPPVEQPPVEQPPVEPSPVEQPTGLPRLRVVGEPAAVVNARWLRELYPTGLPATERKIREATGWSYVRVTAAVKAYHAGADLQPTETGDDDDQERHPEPGPMSATA